VYSGSPSFIHSTSTPLIQTVNASTATTSVSSPN
jgi:hypothetical protein